MILACLNSIFWLCAHVIFGRVWKSLKGFFGMGERGGRVREGICGVTSSIESICT